MTSGFSTLDYVVFILYAVIILFMGLWVSRNKKGTEKTAQEYFLADKSLTWWAVGASLIAANISAEHFIGTSGSGFAIGLAISAYEWMAAFALIIVAKYFLPVFIDNGIYTMPQFLNQRFNRGVSTAFAVFWLLVYVFVNLTSVSYLGALAMESIMGIPLQYGIIGLLLFSAIYSIYGGLEAVAWTDVIQVIFLVGGGLVTTFLALDAVGEGSGIIAGLANIYEKGRDHFSMIIPQGHLFIPDGSGGSKDAFIDLPGIAVIAGAMWATNLGYWGFNQYIIQKGLAAKSINEAKRGLLFAGYLKLLMPLIVVIPGITAYVLLNAHTPEELSSILGKSITEIGTIDKSDQAYPWLLKNFVPVGVRGVAFAALAAAIVSSLASMVNSTSTIFTMDIYRPYFNPDASGRSLVRVGRIVAVVALGIAAIVAPQLSALDQVFQYIQEYTGYIYPGVVAVFGMGLFWRQITANAALWTAIATIPAGILFKVISPDMPFLLRMGYVFIILCVIASVISFVEKGAKVKAPLPESGRQRMLVTYAYVLFVLAAVSLIGAIVYTPAYSYIGIEALYFLAAFFLMVGIILYTNAKIEIADAKAITTDPVLFNTGTPFNIGAAGIILIIGLIYYFLWH
ncbi:sodium/sugar symporter [Pontibacter sp. SGAir0037]|uniref:sodium/sugar symporter n=1 Tax=Pontibacter sp. SGAir0037 TaxID=2571030 RepID=UPI0010CCF5DE|nr:sodium/sugar symporter [Pontibacter sp. SGAir0037]QCR23581.1 sodium/glucose cotransporter [Pontibacter sp. SGAir0037]